jgi:hypothetical protein
MVDFCLLWSPMSEAPEDCGSRRSLPELSPGSFGMLISGSIGVPLLLWAHYSRNLLELLWFGRARMARHALAPRCPTLPASAVLSGSLQVRLPAPPGPFTLVYEVNPQNISKFRLADRTTMKGPRPVAPGEIGLADTLPPDYVCKIAGTRVGDLERSSQLDSRDGVLPCRARWTSKYEP